MANPVNGPAGNWSHMPFESLPPVMQELSNLFEKIKATARREGFQPHVKESLRKDIALFFWLGAQAVPMERGSSQYLLEIHRMLYQMNGFDIAGPTRKWVLPDCVALSMPFEVFYEKYYKELFDVVKAQPDMVARAA